MRSSFEEHITQVRHNNLIVSAYYKAKSCQEFSEDAKFFGYAIHPYDQDEFVGKIEENDIVVNCVYVKILDLVGEAIKLISTRRLYAYYLKLTVNI